MQVEKISAPRVNNTMNFNIYLTSLKIKETDKFASNVVSDPSLILFFVDSSRNNQSLFGILFDSKMSFFPNVIGKKHIDKIFHKNE
jgi:hypothetical protein